MAGKPFSTRNGILLSLAPSALDLLAPHLKLVDLPLRTQLETSRTPVKQVFFMESGMASVVAKVRRKDIEVGIIGREGSTGMSLVMGAPQPLQDIFIQLAASAHAVDAETLQQLLSESADLQKAMLRYSYSFALQSGQTAAANGHGKIDERLARWLLMAHDRMDGNEVALTQEFLSVMLGVRRTGVTHAIRDLTEARLIDTRRATIVIVDRKGLERYAQSIYATPEFDVLNTRKNA